MDDATIGKDTHQERRLEAGWEANLCKRVGERATSYHDVFSHAFDRLPAGRKPTIDHGIGLDDFALEPNPRDRTGRWGGSRGTAIAAVEADGGTETTGEHGSAARIAMYCTRAGDANRCVARVNHPEILPIGVKEVVGAVAEVSHDRDSVPQHREADG